MTDRPHENLELIERVLGEDYLDLRIERMIVEEDFEANQSKVTVHTHAAKGGHKIAVEGQGVGVIDALMNGLLDRYAREYPSLSSIELATFSVKADIDTKEQQACADAVGEVTIEVRNSEGKLFRFSDSSRSVIASAARAVLASVEYFVNAERAFIMLHKARSDAKQRGRADLVQRYTRELSEVVRSTSYTEVIDDIRKELS